MKTHTLTVNEVMTFRAVCTEPDELLFHAYQVMQKGHFHHLPVVKNGVLSGMLTDRHVLQSGVLLDGSLSLGSKLVKDAMSTRFATVTPSERIGDAIDRMLGQGLDSLVVVDGDAGRVLGILTSTDLLVALRRSLGVTDAEAAMAGRFDKPGALFG